MQEALVLAAGKGSRMGAMTMQCPKPLLPVNGRPALCWILDWLWEGGLQRVTLNLHYQSDAFYRTLGTRYREMALCYEEEPVLLGSAGTLRRYLQTVPNRPVLLACGDVLTTLALSRLEAFHAAQPVHPAVTLAVHRISDPHTGGVVTFAGERIVAFQEKPARPASPWVYGGVAIVDPDILAFLPETTPCDLGADVFPALCQSPVPLYGYRLKADDYLLDFGTPERYRRACQEWPPGSAHDPLPNAAAG